MAKITCSINGTNCEIDDMALEPFQVVLDNETETTTLTGYKLFGAVVQNDVHMTLKKPLVWAEGSTAAIG
jgi:hypothetical protein